VRKLRSGLCLLVITSWACASFEGLALEVSDNRRVSQRRVCIFRDASGGKRSLTSDPALTLEAMRRFWTTPPPIPVAVSSPGPAANYVRIASATDGCQRRARRH